MNNKLRISSLLALLVGVVIFGFFKTNGNGKDYTPREKKRQNNIIDGYFQYIHSLKVNPATGTISQQDIKNAKEDLKLATRLNKKDFPLMWESVGPENQGGRTRSIVVDRDDNNILYTSGVSGGIWKSTNKGDSWYPMVIKDAEHTINVSDMIQMQNGDLYAGTGEQFAASIVIGDENSGFAGDGIYKSTDRGETWNRLPASQRFSWVSSFAIDPNGTLFAGTDDGLFYSEDEGQTWLPSFTQPCIEVKISKSGKALAFFRSSGSGFLRSSNNPKDGAQANWVVPTFDIPTSMSRTSIAISPQDDNYVYVLVAGPVTSPSNLSDALKGVYRSTDGGENFERVVGPVNEFFPLFSNLGFLGNSQGNYDNVIAVHPRNKNKVYLGGVELAEWEQGKAATFIANKFESPLNPFGVHADKHALVFDTLSDPIILYIGSDGGVAKTTNKELSQFTSINNGLVTTQFYGVSAGKDGTIVGGTQDNGSIKVKRESLNQLKWLGDEVQGGDGFRSAVSKNNGDIFFTTSYNSLLRRTTNGGNSSNRIFDSRIQTQFVTNNETNDNLDRPSNIFNSSIALWEDPNQDNFGRLFLGLDNGLYFANDALDLDPSKIFWMKVLNYNSSGQNNSNYAHIIEPTASGNHVFVGNKRGGLTRISHLNDVIWDTALIKSITTIPDTISAVNLNLPTSAPITGVSIDRSNENRVLVCVGGYGNHNRVFFTENALDDSPTWRNVTSNLPRIPVYAVEFNPTNPNEVILGTEYGVWATLNINVSSPTWVENNEGLRADLPMPRVPVFDFDVVEESIWSGPEIYAGTHGRGFWKTSSLLTSKKNIAQEKKLSITAYPNPSNGHLEIQFYSKTSQNGVLEIYGLDGSLVKRTQHKFSSGQQNILVSNLPKGTFIYKLSTEHGSGSGKLVIID